MSILRGDLPVDGFTIIPNTWLRDPQLSAKAKGLLCYIASHAAGYRLTVDQMVREMSDSITAIRSGLAELEETGYLKRERSRDEAGRLGTYEYSIGDVSAGQIQSTKSTVENSTVDDPPVGGVTTKKTTDKKTTQEKTKSSTSSRGTRLDKAWRPTEELINWAREHAPGVGWAENERFVDYWIAVPGAKGVKLDWEATWRNWMRRASEERGGRPVSGAPAGAGQSYRRQDQADAARAKIITEVASELIERDETGKMKPAEARSLAEQWIAQREAHPSTTSTGFGYIDTSVIDVVTYREVTDHEAH